MRRHASLIPFSKQHHQMLVLAQLLKSDVPDYRGMPTTIKGKIELLLAKFDEFILPSIVKHRQVFYPTIFLWGFEDDGLIEHIMEQEEYILIQCKALKAGDILTEQKLNDFGYALDALVRTKERELYLMVQMRFSLELDDLKM